MEDLEPGTRIADKYSLVRAIGRGGMGSVWEAINDAVGKRVAIKLLEPSLAKQPEFMRRFELEAQASALIDHPDIIDVIDTGTTEWGAPFMVMELLQGITLRQLLKRSKRVTLEQAVAVVAPLLDALAAAHEAGIVHRDLKPANIFLCIKPRPGVKILDFGISKFAQSDGMTKTGVTLGTPAYMAPEQVRDSRSAGPAADLYSVGAILYALLSGRPPFEGDSDMAVVAQVLTETAAPLATFNTELPPEACRLVDTCLSKDPQVRPASAQSLREALLALAVPDTAWLFTRVREVTPTESRPSMKVPVERPSSRSGSRPAGRTNPSRVSSPRNEAVPDEAPQGATITNSTRASTGTSKGLILGLGAVVLVLVGALGWIMSRPAPQPGVEPPPVVVAEPPVVPAAPKQVELSLKAEPPEARWQLAGAEACNPCTVTRDRGTHLIARITAEGFVSTDLNLDFESARLVTVALQPVATVAVAPAEPPTKRPQPKTKTPTPTPTPKKTLELDETNPYPAR